MAKFLLIDIGSFTGKSVVYADGSASSVVNSRSVVKELTQERLQWLKAVHKVDMAQYTPGFYTELAAGERAAHMQDKWFQLNALAHIGPELLTGVQNIIERTQVKCGVEILKNAHEWNVMFAVAPKETQMAQDHLRDTYIAVARHFGFGAVYIHNQMYFDFRGTYPTWKPLKEELGSTMQETATIFNPGGGDSKLCFFAGGNPLPESLNTKPIGGQKVTDYAVKTIKEMSSASEISDYSVINKWLETDGSCLGGKPGVWDDITQKKVKYNRVEIAINSILRAPEMFFIPEDVKYKMPKEYALHRMFQESVEKTKQHITIDEFLPEWLNCIILTGGASLFYGMAERLQSELHELYPEHAINVRVANHALYTCIYGMVAFLKSLSETGDKIEDDKDHYFPLKAT